MEHLPVPALSLLVLTMPGREQLLHRLRRCLGPQVTPEVELLIDSRPPPVTVGQKRNDLLRRAKGAHIAFIDDDDWVSPDYVQRMLAALSRDPDAVGFYGQITFDGKNPRLFEHSMRHTSWWEDDECYYRPPNHLNPVRRSLALQVGFPTTNHGEDHDYSRRLRPLLKTGEMVELPPVYFYDFRTQK